ncbi:MAG: DUF2938 family protein [Verrucomicrobiales bacterium]|nr:DUF2938 family protein [Verrucomicrobiales bacterium]
MAVGVGATVAMDLWNLLLKRAFGIPSLDLRLLGRWLCHMPGGTFVHSSIAAAAPKTFEYAVGVTAHYTIGIALGLALLLFTGNEWFLRPALLPALLLGVLTVAFPLFVMQPALGLGVASSRSPKPTRARVKSLMSHGVFGLGLFVSGIGVSHILRLLT